MEFYANTHIGKVRTENQDVFHIEQIADGVTLLVVCDGMGGACGGAVAASVAAEALCRRFARLYGERPTKEPPDAFEVHRLFTHAVYYANQAVLERGVAEPALQGMGTTVVAACVIGREVYITNVGDSRAYLLSGGAIRRLTHDDSLVQQMIDEGKMSEEEARTSPDRSILLAAVGTMPYVDLHFTYLTLDGAKGEMLLLCTDGLTSYLTDREIVARVDPLLSLQTSVASLIEGALDGGGGDNITCLLAR